MELAAAQRDVAAAHAAQSQTQQGFLTQFADMKKQNAEALQSTKLQATRGLIASGKDSFLFLFSIYFLLFHFCSFFKKI